MMRSSSFSFLCEKGVLVGVCAILWDFWSERNNRVFRCLERDPNEVWSLF